MTKDGNLGLFKDMTIRKQSICFSKRHTIHVKYKVRYILKLFLIKMGVTVQPSLGNDLYDSEILYCFILLIQRRHIISQGGQGHAVMIKQLRSPCDLTHSFISLTRPVPHRFTDLSSMRSPRNPGCLRLHYIVITPCGICLVNNRQDYKLVHRFFPTLGRKRPKCCPHIALAKTLHLNSSNCKGAGKYKKGMQYLVSFSLCSINLT